MKLAVANLCEDLGSLSRICGVILFIVAAMGAFRQVSSGALSLFY